MTHEFLVLWATSLQRARVLVKLDLLQTFGGDVSVTTGRPEDFVFGVRAGRGKREKPKTNYKFSGLS